MSVELEVAEFNVKAANLIEEVTRFRDASMGMNNIQPTVEAGVAATAEGKYFTVPGNGVYMTLYRRQGDDAAEIAVFLGSVALNDVFEAAKAEADRARDSAEDVLAVVGDLSTVIDQINGEVV